MDDIFEDVKCGASVKLILIYIAESNLEGVIFSGVDLFVTKMMYLRPFIYVSYLSHFVFLT